MRSQPRLNLLGGLVAATGLVLLAGCGGSGGEATGPSSDPPTTPSVADVEVMPPVAASVVGAAAQLEASARSDQGRIITSATFEWISSDESVATVDADGRVTSQGLGRAEITASAQDESATVEVVVVEEDFVSVSASGVSSCGLMSDGRAYCWGGNASGMLGDGTTHDMPTPVPVTGDLSFTALSSGTGASTCGVTDDGVAHCWGHNGNSELGIDSQATETCGGASCSTAPVAVASE